MSDPQEQQQPPPPNAALIRVNNNAVVEWHIDNYQPGSKVKVDVDPDPGGGKHPVAEAVDANTDPSNGAGKFATVISKKGFFTYTVSVTKPSGGKPETATFTVSAQPLTITKLEAAGGSKAEVGKPLKLDYSVDRGQGVKFTLHTKGPNEETDTPVTIDKDGNGTVTVTPKDVGTYKFQINSEDPTLQKGQKNPSSFEISVEVTPALTIKADFVAPTYEHFDFRIQKNVQLPHTFRKKDGKPMIRANRKVRFTWSVDSPTDLSAVGKIQITESKTGDTSDAVFDKKARSAAGDQMVTIKSDATADEEHTLSVVVLGADGKELTRKDVPLVLMPLSKDRADMIEILDFWFPSSLLEPRKDGGKPTKEQDIMAMAGWTVQKGKDSKAEKDAGKVPTTSCGDVLATVLRLWKSTFVGAFAIIDEGVDIPPDKPQLD
ncbi:MAG: hypothetical protein JST92_02570, partial [Deltaproteobacteria bacterium]|nr:hypothetical protein [Deltaproteobacteria bacterium]